MAVVESKNNQQNSDSGITTPRNPDERSINEAVIARWTRRLGIYTGILAVATVLLVAATGISAYFLYETDAHIAGQLSEMHSQNETTRAQVRARISPQPWRIDQVKEGDQITGWTITPHWQNVGSTDALAVKMWWNWRYVDGHYDDFRKLICPFFEEPSDISPRVVLAGANFAQLGQTIPAVWIQRGLSHDGAIFITSHIEYRDIFPGDSLHLNDSCDDFVPNDPTNNQFSFISLRRDDR